MRIFLSGPMTGLVEWNHPAFHRAAAYWRDLGYEVCNPAELFAGSTTRPRADYMRANLAALLQSDVIVMLPGWAHSNGAALEREIAHELGIRVWGQDGPVADR